MAEVPGTPILCPGSEITAAAANSAGAQEICRAAEEGRAVLSALDLGLPTGLRVDIVEEPLDTQAGRGEIGRYDGRQCRIYIMSLRAAAPTDSRSGFGVPMDGDLWRSYIVHELAHAALHALRDRSRLTRAGHEYLAAVAQLSSMPSPLRDAILSRYSDAVAFERVEEISELYYAFNPTRFAIKAYLHAQDPRRRHAYLTTLLPEDRAPRSCAERP